MSHIATIQCRIKDLDVLEQVLQSLGGELRRGQQTFRTYQPNQRCVHAIRLTKPKEAYEVGLRYASASDPTQGFTLAYDNFAEGRHLDTAFGPGLVKLQDEYLAVVAERQLEAGGYRVRREQETPHRTVVYAIA